MSPFVAVDPSVCTGCRECEVVCSLRHFGECSPERSAIRVLRRERRGLVDSLPRVCQQCEEAPCIDACRVDAIHRKEHERGLVAIDPDACIGCGDCSDACPAGCIFIDIRTNVAVCCDLCDGDPECVALCHSHCLTLASGEGAQAPDRVQRLATRLHEMSGGSGPAARGG